MDSYRFDLNLKGFTGFVYTCMFGNISRAMDDITSRYNGKILVIFPQIMMEYFQRQ